MAPVQWQAYTDSHNPWSSTVGPGFVNSTYVQLSSPLSTYPILVICRCQFPQITDEGLRDSSIHGEVCGAPELYMVHASSLSRIFAQSTRVDSDYNPGSTLRPRKSVRLPRLLTVIHTLTSNKCRGYQQCNNIPGRFWPSSGLVSFFKIHATGRSHPIFQLRLTGAKISLQQGLFYSFRYHYR